MIEEFDAAYWREVDQPVFESEVGPILPEDVLDFHTHAWRESDFEVLPGDETRKSASLVFVADEFPFPTLRSTTARLFPGKQYHLVCFGFPFAEMNVGRNNDHIREAIGQNPGTHGILLVRPGDIEEQVRRSVLQGKFIGIKPYWTFVDWKSQNDVLLDDMLTKAHLTVANELGLIVMIHLPRLGRLADPENIKSLRRISAEYPQAKLLVAHVGRSYCSKTVRSGLGQVKDLPNLYFDTTFIQNSVVFEYLFDNFDSGRVVFGSDLPNSAVHGQVVCVNGINLFVTRERYAWSLSNPERPIRATYMVYESIRAIAAGAERAGISSKVVRSVFGDNGRRLIAETLNRPRPS